MCVEGVNTLRCPALTGHVTRPAATPWTTWRNRLGAWWNVQSLYMTRNPYSKPAAMACRAPLAIVRCARGDIPPILGVATSNREDSRDARFSPRKHEVRHLVRVMLGGAEGCGHGNHVCRGVETRRGIGVRRHGSGKSTSALGSLRCLRVWSSAAGPPP